MQDNSKNILTDRGWEAMALILDKEMPQKKKRRFLIWWLFGGLILLLLSYFVFQYSDGNITKPQLTAYEKESQSQAVKTAEQITEVSKSSDTDFVTSNSEANPVESNNSESNFKDNKNKTQSPVTQTEVVEDRKPVNKSDKGNIAEKTIVSKSEVSAPFKSRNVDKVKSKPNVELKKDLIISKDQKLNNPIVETADQVVGKEEVAGAETTDKINIINDDEVQTRASENLVDIALNQNIEEPLKERLILELAKLSPISIFDELRFDREITIVETKAKKPSYWYGNVGGYLNWAPKQKLYGLDTQVDFGHSFNGKFDLGLTFGVGSFRYDGATTEQTAISVAGRSMFSATEASNVLNSSFSNVSHLDLGFHTGYNVSQVIKLRADAGYSYLFSAMFDKNDNGGVGLDSSGSLDVPMGAENMDPGPVVEGEKGQVTEFVYSLDRKWFPYAGLSLQMKLKNNLALDLGYRKVFGELFADSANPLKMDRVRLGIKYRFLNKLSKP